jgi:hypothetical protein
VPLPRPVCRSRRRPRPAIAPAGRRADGQASLEYVAVITVVALVLVVAGAAVAAPSIVNGVGRGFQQALCQVTGQGCRTVTPRPCVVRSAGTDVSASAKLTFVRIGRNTALLRSVSSDGTVSVTLLDNVDAGLTAGVGAGGRLQLGGLDLQNGALAQVAVVARLGGGRTWKVPDVAAADRLQRKLIEVVVGRTGSALPVVGPVLHVAQKLLDVGSGRDLPRPDSRTIKGKVSVSASVEGPFGSELQAAAGVALGGTQDLVSGGGTILLEVDAGGSAALADGMAGLELSGAVGVQLTIDRHGRPTGLALVGSAGAEGSLLAKAQLPHAPVTRQTRGLTAEIAATLDLTVPAHLAAARRLLRALVPGRRGDLVEAARALGRTVARDGRLEITRYGRRERKYGAGVGAALGAEVAVDVGLTRTDAELLDAWTRPPGGDWERRADCLDLT